MIKLLRREFHFLLHSGEKAIVIENVSLTFFYWHLCGGSHLQGHEKEALQLMATYLPKDTSPGSAYQEGGGLYALGLIHANHGGDIIDYLLNQLKNASNDVSIIMHN